MERITLRIVGPDFEVTLSCTNSTELGMLLRAAMTLLGDNKQSLPGHQHIGSIQEVNGIDMREQIDSCLVCRQIERELST